MHSFYRSQRKAWKFPPFSCQGGHIRDDREETKDARYRIISLMDFKLSRMAVG